MSRQWFREQEPAVAEGFGMPRADQVPMRADGDAARVAQVQKTGRSLLAGTVRLLRNALIGAVAMAVVPLAVVAVRGDHLATALYRANGNSSARMLATRPVRAFTVARDPSITPLQAGAALNALQYRRPANGDFQAIVPATHFRRPWRTNTIADEMFPTARPDMNGGPSSRTILEAVAKGFSPREQAYLAELAQAPIWREFDLVARAPEVDVLGGQLRLPFDADALPEMRPLPSYRDSKELAYAAVSRAAYYMSIGQPREAERVLRSIISFGFAITDNGTTTLDELIGTVIVGIGRDALQRFYLIEHDPRAGLAELAMPQGGDLARSRVGTVRPSGADEVRRQLLAVVADPAAPRPERFEAVRALSLMQCSTVRGLLFGQDGEVQGALERARSELARYPSERALIDLDTHVPSGTRVATATGPFQSLLVSPAAVAGAVLHNPRMAACTLLLTNVQ
ncbi:MAG TPA: hypothetical protein VFY85_14190 [Gemmatimonadaceae bacterium]|nr:hypothetical protein [Gemmatimonadaceae bacterium]